MKRSINDSIVGGDGEAGESAFEYLLIVFLLAVVLGLLAGLLFGPYIRGVLLSVGLF